MDELISRRALLEAMKQSIAYRMKAQGMDKVVGMVQNAPTIEPVRHGRWVEKEYVIDDEIFEAVVCGECEANRVAGLGLAKYCYVCGARMDTVALSKTETTTEEENDG